MANPIKAVKAAKRLIVGSNKDFKTNKGINKKLDKILNTSVISQGKQKAINKAAKLNTKIEKYSDGQYYVTPNRAGNKIVFTGNRIKEIPITGSNKKINKNLREAVFKAGGKGKLTNKPIVRLKKIEKKTPKVPTKRRGR